MPVANYKSPAQLSMGRCLHSILPCTTSHLIPETICYCETQARFLKKQTEQKANYDKPAVPLQPLKTGETVCVKQEGEWRPTKVIEIADTPRSYFVKTSEGAVYRRNRRHLHKDTSQDRSILYTDGETNAEMKQPTSAEQEQQPQSSEDQQHEANNNSDGYRTRSGRLVKVPDRY